MRNFISLTRKHGKRGFTLLLAALVATIILALGSSIFSIAQKQLILSSIGRDSQFAFYAADTAAECALYWDIRFNAFATSTSDFEPVPINCDGKVRTPEMVGSPQSGAATSTFQLDLFVDSPSCEDDEPEDCGNCVEVTVAKRNMTPFTVIHADGYTVNCAQRDSSDRTLQRSIELRY